MKIRLVTAAFGSLPRQLEIRTTFSKGNQVDISSYDDSNTPSRINSLHPRLKGKIPKMMEWMEYPDYDFYIWIDSKFVILDGFLEKLFQLGTDSDLYLFPHPERTSIRQELDYMNLLMGQGNSYLKSRYDGEEMDKQVNTYLNDEKFIDDKLFSLGCFMYSKKLVENKDHNVMTDWLLHNTLYSIQDQLSLPYLLQKHNVNYKVYSENLVNNNFSLYYG